MQFERLNIPDVILIKPKIFGDERGYFMESFKQQDFEQELGQKINFIQDNESKSSRGVLRGLHYQIGDYAQSKLVRVISGEVLDVAVDIRKNSPTFGKSIAVKLNDKNKYQLFIPKGFAHGFVVLSAEAIFSYKVDNDYKPEFENGIIFDDKDLNIDWILPKNQLQLSDKDKILPNFKEITYE
jgi:dTDP-4-dehydrorhamnose 3,5-epimerase